MIDNEWEEWPEEEWDVDPWDWSTSQTIPAFVTEHWDVDWIGLDIIQKKPNQRQVYPFENSTLDKKVVR